tara:strand:- start:367 stop:543 length:177 start_codon:yes stop_codon:yes gene_type:complete
MAYPQDVEKKNKRKEELSIENLDKQITQYYFQRSKDNKDIEDFTEVKYASGRVVKTTL